MSVRNNAVRWYKEKYGKIDLPIHTSKFFQPNESWPKKSVWWPQIPISKIVGSHNSYINILCQVAPNKNNFHHLKVPTKFLQEHLNQFHILKSKITLYLSTEVKELFIELRGTGRLDFSKFLVN